MPTAARRVRERLETRTKILDAARDLFVGQGYEAVSMRRIAEAIEYSPTAIYVHFKDKEALFHEVCRCDFLGLADAFRKIVKVPDPVERIRQLGHAYVRFALEHPNHYRLMFMTPKPPPPPGALEEAKADPSNDGYGVLLAAVKEGLKQDRFRPEYANAHLLAQTFWAACHGVASLEITLKNDPFIDWAPVKKRVNAMVDGILRGLVRSA